MKLNALFSYSVIFTLFISNVCAQKTITIDAKDPIQYINKVVNVSNSTFILGVYRASNRPPTPAVWLLDKENNLQKVIDQKDIPRFRGAFQNIMITEKSIILLTLNGFLYTFSRSDYALKSKIKIQYANPEIIPLSAGEGDTFHKIGDYYLINAFNGSKPWPDPGCFSKTDFALGVFDQKGQLVKSLGTYPKAYTNKYIAHQRNFLVAQPLSGKKLLVYRHTNPWIEVLSTDRFEVVKQIKIPILQELAGQIKTVSPEFKDKPYDANRSKLTFAAQSPFISNLYQKDDLVSFLYYTPLPSERANKIELIQYNKTSKKQIRTSLGTYKYDLQIFKHKGRYAGLRYDRKNQQLILIDRLED